MVFANSEHPTLPRLHQEHKLAVSGSLVARGGSFFRTTLEPSLVVGSSIIGQKAGLSRMATMAFSSTACTWVDGERLGRLSLPSLNHDSNLQSPRVDPQVDPRLLFSGKLEVRSRTRALAKAKAMLNPFEPAPQIFRC